MTLLLLVVFLAVTGFAFLLLGRAAEAVDSAKSDGHLWEVTESPGGDDPPMDDSPSNQNATKPLALQEPDKGIVALMAVAAGCVVGLCLILSLSSLGGGSNNSIDSVYSPALMPSGGQPSDDYLQRELDDIESEAIRRVLNGETYTGDLQRRLDQVEDAARSRMHGMNRKTWEPGYSLGTRRRAAYETLMQRGYSADEAKLTVDAMEQYNLLPDPLLE